jgi:hypothetical protein
VAGCCGVDLSRPRDARERPGSCLAERLRIGPPQGRSRTMLFLFWHRLGRLGSVIVSLGLTVLLLSFCGLL